MTRAFMLAIALATATSTFAEPGLPPPVESVLSELSLDDAKRAEVRATLLRQSAERRQQREPLKARHQAELAALLTPDQLVALRAAMPPPPGHHSPRQHRR